MSLLISFPFFRPMGPGESVYNGQPPPSFEYCSFCGLAVQGDLQRLV